MAAKKAYTSLRIILVYECNANVVYFDGVQLFNASGQRISKTVNGTTYNYHYLGDQLVEMAWGANRMHFTYDAVGPLSVNFNGTEYFYLRNAQGDVTGLVDSAGTKVVSYAYDPWGKTWDASGMLASTLGTFNPLRYRGYVYDTETGLYYLNSRYYNPTWGRFINADSLVTTDTSNPKSANVFSHCENNPVNMADSSGLSPYSVLGLLDYAAIHSKVQSECVQKKSWVAEVYVRGAKGRGYLDLYDEITGSYYEVKSLRASQRISTQRQMQKYDVATIADTPLNRMRFDSSVIGQSLKRGMQQVDGKFQYGIYDVDYWLQNNGLIEYSPRINWGRAETAVTVAGVLVLLALCPGAAPLYAAGAFA